MNEFDCAVSTRREIQRILKIREERERERGRSVHEEKFPKTRFYEGSSEHQVVKARGATR